MNEPLNWNNYDNKAFYKKIKEGGLREYALKAGLSTGCDVKILTPYWSKVNSILEVGAGYGRVIEYLLNQKYSGKITAIERCETMIDFLKINYSKENVTILHNDIHDIDTINFKEKFDLILWLWSGIFDFTSLEQEKIILSFSRLLNENGKLIIDTLPENALIVGTKEKEKTREYKVELANSIVYMHWPSQKEINEYAYLAKFNKITLINYFTDNNRERVLQILE